MCGVLFGGSISSICINRHVSSGTAPVNALPPALSQDDQTDSDPLIECRVFGNRWYARWPEVLDGAAIVAVCYEDAVIRRCAYG